jgi:hypothetical protein
MAMDFVENARNTAGVFQKNTERLFAAAAHGRLDEARTFAPFCRQGAVNGQGETPLMVAAQNGHGHMVRDLALRCNPEAADHRGRTALMHAVLEDDGRGKGRGAGAGKSEAVDALAKICNPNIQDNEGLNALMHAALRGDERSADRLMGSTDLCAIDAKGRNAAACAKTPQLAAKIEKKAQEQAVDRALAQPEKSLVAAQSKEKTF